MTDYEFHVDCHERLCRATDRLWRKYWQPHIFKNEKLRRRLTDAKLRIVRVINERAQNAGNHRLYKDSPLWVTTAFPQPRRK